MNTGLFKNFIALFIFTAVAMTANAAPGIATSAINDGKYKLQNTDASYSINSLSRIILDTNDLYFDGTPSVKATHYYKLTFQPNYDIIPNVNSSATNYYTWQDISDEFASTKEAFKKLEDKFGKFKFVDIYSNLSSSHRVLHVKFEKYVDEDDFRRATIIIQGVSNSELLETSIAAEVIIK